jgi:hypothetical protein
MPATQAYRFEQPVIDRVFQFAKAKEAYRYFGDRNDIGKVAITGD